MSLLRVIHNETAEQWRRLHTVILVILLSTFTESTSIVLVRRDNHIVVGADSLLAGNPPKNECKIKRVGKVFYAGTGLYEEPNTGFYLQDLAETAIQEGGPTVTGSADYFAVHAKPIFAWRKMPVLTEADTCRLYILSKLYGAGWTDEQISEQKSFTDGRIVVAGTKVKRRPQKRADYLLRYRRDFPIAVVEAKTIYAHPGDGLQQAKEYAQILGLKFAYATNGKGIVDGQGRTPVAPEAGQPDPQQAVRWGQLAAFSRGALQHVDLVAQSQVL